MVAALQSLPSDSISAVLREVFASPEYAWETRAHPLQFFIDRYRDLLRWLGDLGARHPVAYWVVVGLLTGVLLLVLAHLAYLIWRALRPRVIARGGAVATPLAVRDAAWHVREALRLAREGRFAEALGHRFLVLVLELDRRRVVRFHPSKTPAEYVVEARLDPSATVAFRDLVSRLYGHLFAGLACRADDLAAFDAQANAVVASRATA